MSISRPMGKNLADLLAHPPGDGITVTQVGYETEVKIKADISGKYIQRMVLIGVPCALLGCMAIGSIVQVTLDAEYVNWPLVLSIGLFGLPAFFVGMTCIGLMLLAKGIRCTITLGKDECTITDRGTPVKVPWSDIRGVRVLRKKKRGRQLHAKCDWPWVKGDGDGLAIETPDGSFETMGMWHNEVSEWVARLLCAHPTNSTIDIEVFEKSLIESAGHRGMPMKIDRGVMFMMGLPAIFISIFFVWGFSPSILESIRAKDWPSTVAMVESSKVVDRDAAHDKFRVTYRYEVERETYTNDRYGFGSGYSGRVERKKARMSKGDTVTIFYDPKDPGRSVIDRGFPFAEAILSMSCAGVGLFGISAMIYGIFGKNSVLAEKYALETDTNA